MSIPYILEEKSVTRKIGSPQTIEEVLEETLNWLNEFQFSSKLSNLFYYATVFDIETKRKYHVYSDASKNYFQLDKNNLEVGVSISLPQGADVYSEEETLTNKIYKGKCVYRKIVNLNGTYIKDSKWHTIPYPNLDENIEVFDVNVLGSDNYDIGYQVSSTDFVRSYFTKNGFSYAFGSSTPSVSSYTYDVVIEYTKLDETLTTDV